MIARCRLCLSYECRPGTTYNPEAQLARVREAMVELDATPTTLSGHIAIACPECGWHSLRPGSFRRAHTRDHVIEHETTKKRELLRKEYAMLTSLLG